MLGTQFIIPTQVDPRVLAELPEDIRTKLLRQARQSSPTPVTRKVPAEDDPNLPSKDVPFAMTALPAESQLDPEILAALPPEVRGEVLAQYAAESGFSSPSRRSKHADQTLLPQSPRKNRIIGIPAKKPIAPVKRGRGRPPKSAMLTAAAQTKSLSKTGKTLTQANFISLKNPVREPRSREGSAGPLAIGDVPTVAPGGQANEDELYPDFLSALPPEIRKEVIAEHKRKKLQSFRLAVTRKQKPVLPAVSAPRPAQTIKVPRPPLPTFTTQKLSQEKDLRGAMRDWVKEFANDGPYPEDVAALAKYLGKVVCDERKMSKAVGIAKWLDWVVGEEADHDEVFAKKEWTQALEVVRNGVRQGGKKRGLGAVSFD